MTTPEDRHRRRIEDGLARGEYIIRPDGKVACAFCGGNCGQCGETERLGNIGFSFETVVASSQTVDGKPSLRHPEPKKAAWLFRFFNRKDKSRP